MKTFTEFLDEMQMVHDHKYGTYASLSLSKSTSSRLANWCSQKHIENPIPQSDFHCTVIYSKIPAPDMKGETANLPINAHFKEWKIFNENTLVIILDSPEIHNLHKSLMKKYGTSYDYKKYLPHVSISYDYSGELPDKNLGFDFIFDSFEVKPLEGED